MIVPANAYALMRVAGPFAGADPDFLLELEVASDTVLRKTKQILGPCGVPPNVCIQTIGGSTFE
jgi:hypothetical protein